MTGHAVETCALCGELRPSDAVEALAWAREDENGRTRWLCPRCARRHVRDIEGKLPSDHW